MPEFEEEPSSSTGYDSTRAVSAPMQGRGLFRGRYGTAAEAHGTGEIVIRFPYRYRDRWVLGADAPEMHYFQVDERAESAFYKAASWKHELPVQGVSIECLARLDARVPWTTDPLASTPPSDPKTTGLWLLRGAGG